MPYVNTIERLGIEKGRQETLEEAEQRVLESKRDTARHLLQFGVLSDDQIAEATGLAVEVVAKLRIEDKH